MPKRNRDKYKDKANPIIFYLLDNLEKTTKNLLIENPNFNNGYFLDKYNQFDRVKFNKHQKENVKYLIEQLIPIVDMNKNNNIVKLVECSESFADVFKETKNGEIYYEEVNFNIDNILNSIEFKIDKIEDLNFQTLDVAKKKLKKQAKFIIADINYLRFILD